MIFDEIKRKNLLKAYMDLPEYERAAFRIFAVASVPTGIKNLIRIFHTLGVGLNWSEARCVDMLERWAAAKLAEKRVDRSVEDWLCAPLIAETAVREALDNEEYDDFDAAGADVLKLRGEELSNKYSSITKFMRVMRRVLYQGDLHGYERLMVSEVMRAKQERYADFREANPFVRILANPLDIERILPLPSKIGRAVFFNLMPLYADDAADFAELLAAYDAYRLKNPADVDLAEDWAEYAALAGRADEAARAMKELNSAEKYSIAAMAALIRGDNEKALLFYEDGMKLLRKAEGKRKTGYLSWTGIFYPILLLGSAAKNVKNPEEVPEKKIESYLDNTRARFGKHTTSIAFEALRFLLPQKVKKDDFWRILPMLIRDQGKIKPLDSFFYILCAYWLDARNAKEEKRMLGMAVTTYRRLTEMKFDFPALELAALIRELWPDAIDCGKLALPRYPLKDLIHSQSEWERSLSALSGIGLKAAAGPRGAKRFVWEVSWKSDKIGKSSDRRPSYINLTPVEQTLSSSGWSKGKNIALRRLYSKADTVASMTDQDLRAASAVHENRLYYGIEYSLDVPQALEALAGHPYLFRESDGGRVEVVTGEPQLMAVMKEDSYRLRISPFPCGDKTLQRVVQEDGPNCLRVIRFEERHVKMAEILGEEGLLIPDKAKDTLLKTLGILASVVTVHSDIEGIETGAVQTEADARVYIQLQPCDDGFGQDAGDPGPAGLDVDMVVRPLGPGSVSCRPGTGGQNIFGLVDSKRTQAKRSLEKEKDSFIEAVRACPALAEAVQTANERWRLPDPEMALEFLTQVQELGDSVVVEWPKGQSMRVKYRIPISSMGLSVRNSQDWFAISGELRIDEELVLGMKDLMELMKTGYGRFIPIGEGQFVALTREFRRRLEALSAMGDTKGNELRVSPLSVGVLAPLLDELGSFKSNAEWKRVRKRIEEASALTPSPPSTFKGKLRNYQTEGYQWMSRLAHWGAGACLADDMGLGKTIQALALLTERGSGGPALVVAPTSVCANWLIEAGRFAPTLNVKELRHGDREKTLGELEAFDVIVTTYGLLQNEADRLSDVKWHTIVLDEAQAIKNMGTKRSAAAMKLEGDFRLATTGTPIENRLSELWNIFRFLNPHFLGSLESFNRRFAVPIERDGDKKARMRLKRVIQPFILRRSKEQVLEELPPKTEITIRVELNEEEQAFYEALRRNAVEELSAPDSADQRFKIFAELMRLRRACCNASLVM
ncbi:MAG: SNF2-related protein, partial [Synergistaceae bacterium]|nr:SNF2-related protein [Synergistaceae bacterium]